jgi:hypothetical protein
MELFRRHNADILTLLVAGSLKGQLGGGLEQPPPLNFTKKQLSCLKMGMPIAKGISNYAKFVS